MKGPLTNFPVNKTTVPGLKKKFDLNDRTERKNYFEAKVGPEIAKLKKYFKNNTFVAYLLGKKNSGKGTYTKLMAEIFGADKIGHISVGDLVRETHKIIEDPKERKELMKYLSEHYRGYISIDDAIDALIGKNQKVLLPTEFIMALVKREIDKRMRNRVVCPICQSPRNLTTFPTKRAGYDKKTKQFFLKCDNPECNGARMVDKEGDNAGIESIRDRLELDNKLIKKVMSLHGIPKILLRNAVPVNSIKDGIVDEYEITPKYVFKHDKKTDEVTINEEPWVVKDDEGVDSYSLLAPPVAVTLIKQLVKALEL